MTRLGVCLVVGGSGWTGSFLVGLLSALSDSLGIEEVHSADLCDPSVELCGLHKSAQHHYCDVSDGVQVSILIRSVNPTVVFHLASVIDLRLHAPDRIDQVNVKGTSNIISALNLLEPTHRRCLVYTSTIDVVSATWGVCDADEKTPYSREVASNHYKRTKILAEKSVLAAHCDLLRTVALRPGHIFGPGDPILGHVLASPVGLGNKDSSMSFVYVQNCAYAHILAALSLLKECEKDFFLAKISGSAMFVTDFNMNFSDAYCQAAGKKKVSFRLPWWLVLAVVFIVEIIDHIVYYSLGTCFQHPVTGISRSLLEATSILTAKSDLARSAIQYGTRRIDNGCGKKIGVLLPAECMRRTKEYVDSGNVIF